MIVMRYTFYIKYHSQFHEYNIVNLKPYEKGKAVIRYKLKTWFSRQWYVLSGQHLSQPLMEATET